MKNNKQLPLLPTSNLFNSAQNFTKTKFSQSSVQENSNMKQSSKSDNQMISHSKSRYSQFQDTSFLQQKSITPKQLSKIIKNPQIHEYQQTNTRTNFYGKLHRNSVDLINYKTSVTEIDSKDGALDFSPFIKNAKSSQLQYFLKKIIQQQSEKIELSTSLPNRQQVIELQQWFDYMIEQVKESVTKQNKDGQAVAEDLQLIYSSCIQELIRQISIECKERGQLLERIWNSYISLLDEIVHNINQTNKKEYSELLSQQQFSTQNQKLQNELEILQEDFRKQELYKQTLEKKIQQYEIKIIKQNTEIKMLYQRIEEMVEGKKQLENEIVDTDQYKQGKQQIKLPLREGKSIVSHLMTKKARLSNEIKTQSLSPIQFKKTSEDELSKTPLSQLQQEFDAMDDFQLTGFKQLYRKATKTENVILDEKAVMTDRMCFSSISILNDFIHNFINNGLQAIFNEVAEEEYRNSIDIIRCATSISIEQEEYVIQTLNKSQIKQKVFENLYQFLNNLESKVSEFQVKSVEQQLQIKEHQLVAKNLEQNLREATQDFADILEDRQQKIEILKEGQKLLLKKLSSLSQDPMSSNISSKRSPQFNSPSRKTPNFKHTFDFNKDIVAEELNLQKVEEDEDVENSIQQPNAEQSFNIQQKKDLQLNLTIKEQFLDDQVKDASLENKDEINNSFAINNLIRKLTGAEEIEDTQETQMPQKMKNLKNLIQKFGMRKESNKKLTKPIEMRSSIMQELKQDKQKVKKVVSPNTEAANQLIKELQSKPSAKQIGKLPILPLVQLQKIIYTLLQEAGKTQDGFKVPLQVAIYDFFLKKYGFKNVAEKKIKQIFSFMVSKLQISHEQAIKQKHHSQIKILFFARLCYMNGEMDELIQKITIESIKYFTQKEINFVKIDQLISMESLNYYCEELLIKFLGQNIVKQYQITLKDKKDFIFENEMMTIIDLYFLQKSNCENILEIIIKAADLNGNSLIEFAEFKTLYKAIHPEIYTKQKALENFITFADYFDTETKDKMITLKRFAEMAIELNLFNSDKILEYSQGSEQLIQKWQETKNLIKYRYIVSETFHKVSYTFQLLTEEIPNFMEKKESKYNLQTLWISYKLLLERSQRVILNFEQKKLFKELVPIELGLITEVYGAITEINI